jgi:hypothetical protein
MSSIDSPLASSSWQIRRPEKPASMRIFVFSVVRREQLPELPLPSIENFVVIELE